jgi:hypothetical protein
MSGNSEGAKLGAKRMRGRLEAMRAAADAHVICQESLRDALPMVFVSRRTAEEVASIESAAALRLAQSLGVGTP